MSRMQFFGPHFAGLFGLSDLPYGRQAGHSLREPLIPSLVNVRLSNLMLGGMISILTRRG